MLFFRSTTVGKVETRGGEETIRLSFENQNFLIKHGAEWRLKNES